MQLSYTVTPNGFAIYAGFPTEPTIQLGCIDERGFYTSSTDCLGFIRLTPRELRQLATLVFKLNNSGWIKRLQMGQPNATPRNKIQTEEGNK